MELASFVSPLLAASIVYVLGKRAYLAQKEYELVQHRYLFGAVDAVGEQFQYLLSTFFQNYEQGLNALRYFRERGKDMPRSLLEETAYLRVESRAFDNAPHYLLMELTGTPLFHSVYQHLHASVQSQRQFLAYDFGTYAKIHFGELPGDRPTMEKEEAAEKYLDELKRRNREIQKYYLVVQNLQALSTRLSRRRFTFAEVSRFHMDISTKECVRKVQEFYDTIKAQSGFFNAET